MDQATELWEIFERNFPFVVRDKGTALGILGHEGNTVLEERDAQGHLIGAAVINKSTILMLCVDKEYRNRGIGSRLLREAEEAMRADGFDKINVGGGFDYLAPGVPTAKRYYAAENEKLYPGLDEAASDFFTKRGYVHSWECNCFDMRFPLCEFSLCELGNKSAGNDEALQDSLGKNHSEKNSGVEKNSSIEKSNGVEEKNSMGENSGMRENTYSVGIMLDKITYRLAVPSDRDAVCACTDAACPEFTEYYRADGLYHEGNSARVFIADAGDEVAGTLIVGVEDAEKSLGSVGCTTVRPTWRGRHIAVNLVTIGTKYLKEIGLREAYLSYTYTGLDHMYGYAGYKICVYFMMAQKNIGDGK